MLRDDSSTYQSILEEGRALGRASWLQQLVLRAAGERFGPATPAIIVTVEAIPDRERLVRMAKRLADATGWDDLLATN